MKKIAFAMTIVFVSICGANAFLLSESSARNFLDQLDRWSLAGNSAEYCAHLAADMKVSIRDHTSPGMPKDFNGGKRELCDYVSMAAKGVDLIGPQSQATRHDFRITREWLHPWTARVSYHETRTTVLTKVNVTLKTVSDDRWILAYTLQGMKVRHLSSESRPAN